MSAPTAKPTRQQLDELDDMLQRMLALPTNPPGPELPPPPAPTPVIAPHAPASVGDASQMRPPVPAPPPPAPPRRAAPPAGDYVWNVALPADAGGASFAGWPVGIEALAPGGAPQAPPRQAPAGRLNVTMVPPPTPEPQAARPAAAVTPMPQEAGAPPAPPRRPAPMPVPLPPAFAEAPLPFFLWPLGALDRSVGGVLAAFGPPGRWLGQGGGKILAGWAGLLMLAAAVAWGVMDYMGWAW